MERWIVETVQNGDWSERAAPVCGTVVFYRDSHWSVEFKGAIVTRDLTDDDIDDIKSAYHARRQTLIAKMIEPQPKKQP